MSVHVTAAEGRGRRKGVLRVLYVSKLGIEMRPSGLKCTLSIKHIMTNEKKYSNAVRLALRHAVDAAVIGTASSACPQVK